MRRVVVIASVLVAVLLVAFGIRFWFAERDNESLTVTAEFISSTGVYVGDPVIVLGVPVGKVEAIDPTPASVRVTLKVDADVKLPADAKAAIVAQSLVAARSVQISPAYKTGPRMDTDAVIPLARTVVPMEWDDIKNSLFDITKSIGRQGPDDPGSAAKVVTSGADALAPHADAVNETITQLSTALAVLSDGRTDLFAIVRNLQVFVSAMSASNGQVESLQQSLATVTNVLGSNRTQVSEAVTALDDVLGNIQTFVSENRDILTANVESITEVTTTLAQQRADIEGVLHQAPTQVANFYNLYKPGTGSMAGVFTVPNFENPIQAVCGAVAAAGQATSERAGDLCAQYLGPYLNTLKTSYPDLLISPTTGTFADPGQQIPSEPGLLDRVPGLSGPPPPNVKRGGDIASLLLPKAGR